jgi:hypothetical protein
MSLCKFLKLLLAVPISLACVGLYAQSNSVRQAEKKIDQGNWSAARQILVKAFKKDTLNSEIEVALSNWFLAEQNPSQQIDTAYSYCLKALSHFCKLPAKQKEKLKRDLIDSSAIVSLRARIESASFEKAKQINSEKSYNDYLGRYTFSIYRPAAIELRDEAAFLDALKQNSYKAFETYINKYSKSQRSNEAKSRYEKLLFESRTHDHKLKSYEVFVKEFPESPYRKESEKNIFEVLTSSGTSQDFVSFIETHAENHYANLARGILFHEMRELDEKIPTQILTDSLRNVSSLNKLIWAPFFKNGKYGFIDSEGTETLPEQFENIDESYKCGLVESDLLMTNLGLVSRSGKILSKAKSFRDLGYGFVKLIDSCVTVMHKSGVIIQRCVDDAFVVGGRYLAIVKNKKIGLVALNGKELLESNWNSIEMIEDVIVLDRNGKKILATAAQLQLVADGNALDESFVVDEVRSFGKNRLLVRNGALEGIVDSNLKFVVPLAMQKLSPTSFGLLRKINDQFIFEDIEVLNKDHWDKYSVHRQWLHLKNTSGEKLFDSYSKKIIESNPDSIWFESGLAFSQRGDSVHVHINSLHTVSLHADAKVIFIKSPDSVRYFYVQQKNRKTIFSIESGLKMFTTDYDHIESLTAEFFLVQKKNKKGVINVKGKIVLPVEYDILLLKENSISLYKDKKFGLYNMLSSRMIKPMFEKNLIAIDTASLIAFRNGRYGVIDWTGKNITDFEYDEIQPWAIDMIWVRKDFEWSLIDFALSKKILSRIKNFQLIKNTSQEKIAIVKQENLFGIVSTLHGVVIPPTFSFLMNLGNEEEPFYFTSKEVEEAGIVAVIYYDKMGKLLRKQVYEDEEYARIVCPQD